MSLICAITNEVPETAVVSPFSGCVFEKRVIEKYIQVHGKDPVSNDDLSVEQLIDLRVSNVVKPRPPTATSIPALLKMLQDEWDANMLHSFTLRQQLHTARQELSHALYKHDAACRVIARLKKECALAKEALATLKPHAAAPVAVAVAPAGPAPQYPMETEEQVMEVQKEVEGISEAVIKKLHDKAAVLTSARKQRGKTVPEDLAKVDDIRNLSQTSTHVGLHSASIPGITCLDIHAADPNMILTGGNDKNAIVFNKETEQVEAVFKGHQKKVSNVIYHPTEGICITSSPDTMIKVWSVKEAACTHTLRPHTGPITGISLHATGDYILSVSSDENWAFSDLRTGQVLVKVADTVASQPMTCAQFHPDGLIFGTGTADSLIKIWDLKEKANVANFPGHTGSIRSISFSENGYYLATAADDAVVKLWDLRKLKNFKTISLDERFEVKDLCFDQSGTYLAVAGTDIRVYMCKQWQELCVLSSHTDMATGVRFGKNATYLASTSMDRSLRFYGYQQQQQQEAD